MLNIKTEISQNDWNENLFKCLNSNIFSTWEWGEFKSKGWRLERLSFYNGETFVGMIQILFKNIGPIKLGWCSSGINLTDYAYLEGIIESLEQKYNFKKTLLRINFFDEGVGNNQFYIDSITHFKFPLISINSGYTIRFNLLQFLNTPKTYSSNNRYYLGKAVKNNLQFEIEKFNPQEFSKVHNEMAALKDLNHLAVDADNLAEMYRIFGDQMFTALVKNESELLSMCAVIKWKDKAYYFLAAANENGRKLSASFLMVHKLIDFLKSNEVIEFDFGGITPFKKSAVGVNRFKIGFSGKIIRYAGERDLTQNKFLYWGFNLLLRFKKIA